MFRFGLFPEKIINPAAKEVKDYVQALKKGFYDVKENQIITSNKIIEIQKELVSNNAGYRKMSGTVLKNDQSGETIYTPPQNPEEIIKLMTNLEIFINDDSVLNIDPLIKMAVIHYQFESIHPFYDGNGRTGKSIYFINHKLLNLFSNIPEIKD